MFYSVSSDTWVLSINCNIRKTKLFLNLWIIWITHGQEHSSLVCNLAVADWGWRKIPKGCDSDWNLVIYLGAAFSSNSLLVDVYVPFTQRWCIWFSGHSVNIPECFAEFCFGGYHVSVPWYFAVCCLIEQHVYVPCCLASIMCIHRVALRWFLCRNQWDKKMRKHLLIDCISSNFQPLICNLYATNYFMCMLNTVNSYYFVKTLRKSW